MSEPICCIKTCNDPAEDRPNSDGDYLCPDHMQDWHDGQLLFPRHNDTKPADHLGRSDKDFAIEFGEYLAREAEAFLKFINETGIAAHAKPQDALTDRWRGLQSAIYEFRKRAIRADIPTADHLYGESKPSAVVTRLTRGRDFLEAGAISSFLAGKRS